MLLDFFFDFWGKKLMMLLDDLLLGMLEDKIEMFWFQSLFTINPCQHPIVILKDIRFCDLKTMVDFMYYGEVNVSQEQLPAILKIAEMLKIKGLADMPSVAGAGGVQGIDKDGRRSSSPASPAARRKRLRKCSTGSGSGSTGKDFLFSRYIVWNKINIPE